MGRGVLLTVRIEVNPEVMLGKSVVRGTRIPVELILRKLTEDAREANQSDAYPRLTVEDIRAGPLIAPMRFPLTPAAQTGI
jgi:uncharacterized protein (DUF433 family)